MFKIPTLFGRQAVQLAFPRHPIGVSTLKMGYEATKSSYYFNSSFEFKSELQIRGFRTSSILLHGAAGHGPGYHDPDNMDITAEQASQDIYMVEKKEPEQKHKMLCKVKDFFNPHKTMNQIWGHSHGSGENHSHHHHHGTEAAELYDPEKLTDKGVKITWVGFGVNLSMAVAKLIGGIVFHSQALLADSVHSFSDLISDILTLCTVRFTVKKPNIQYPLGFGKVETFGSLLVSGILIYAGLEIGFHAIGSIIAPYLPAIAGVVCHWLPFDVPGLDRIADLQGTAVAASIQTADINAAWLALASIVAKEWLFRATKKVGEQMNSKVLIANAWHHRVDSLTSVVAVLTISAGYFLNIYWMDSVGGLIVAMLVMRVGLSNGFQSFKELIDKAMPRDDPRYADLEDAVNVQLMKQDPNILIKELAVLPSGTNMNVVLKLGVSEFNDKYESQLTLDKMGKVAEILRGDVTKEFPNVKNMSVQFISNSEKNEVPEDEQKENEIKERAEAEKKKTL